MVLRVSGAYFGQTESSVKKDENRESVFKRLTESYGKRIEKFVNNPIETIIAVVSILFLIILMFYYF